MSLCSSDVWTVLFVCCIKTAICGFIPSLTVVHHVFRLTFS